MLQEQTDAFSQRKIKVLWRWSELDLRSIRQAQQIFREELAAAGIGTFISEEETVGSQLRCSGLDWPARFTFNRVAAMCQNGRRREESPASWLLS